MSDEQRESLRWVFEQVRVNVDLVDNVKDFDETYEEAKIFEVDAVLRRANKLKDPHARAAFAALMPGKQDDAKQLFEKSKRFSIMSKNSIKGGKK